MLKLTTYEYNKKILLLNIKLSNLCLHFKYWDQAILGCIHSMLQKYNLSTDHNFNYDFKKGYYFINCNNKDFISECDDFLNSMQKCYN